MAQPQGVGAPRVPGCPREQKLGKRLVGGLQQRTEGVGTASEGKGGDFLKQWRGSCSSAEVSLWVCAVMVVVVVKIMLKAPTQHHDKLEP